MGTTDPRLVEATHAERERLTSLFTDFDNDQWDATSLCEGWRNREVLAHMTMPFRNSLPRFLGGMIRARFNFNRYADRDARATARSMTNGELTELFRANVHHAWQPPGGGQAGALSHDVIHGLDITEPLGLAGPPPSRIAMVLGAAGPSNLAFFGVDLAGKRLVATDADCAIGDGTEHHLSARELLLVVTGRRALADVTGTAS